MFATVAAARLDSEIADIEDIKLQGHSQSVQDKSIYRDNFHVSLRQISSTPDYNRSRSIRTKLQFNPLVIIYPFSPMLMPIRACCTIDPNHLMP